MLHPSSTLIKPSPTRVAKRTDQVEEFCTPFLQSPLRMVSCFAYKRLCSSQSLLWLYSPLCNHSCDIMEENKEEEMKIIRRSRRKRSFIKYDSKTKWNKICLLPYCQGLFWGYASCVATLGPRFRRGLEGV